MTFPRFVPLSDQAVIPIRHHPPGSAQARSPVGSFVATSGQTVATSGQVSWPPRAETRGP